MTLPDLSWAAWTLYGIGYVWLFCDGKGQMVKQRDWNLKSAAVLSAVCFFWPIVVPLTIAFKGSKP